MKKSRNIIAAIGGTLLVAGAIALAVAKANDSQKLSDFAKANINALASGEFDPIGNCNSWCVDSDDAICTLKTNYGFTITCHDMRRKY